jgi:hypothetical protein
MKELHQKLFDYFAQEYDILILESDVIEILEMVKNSSNTIACLVDLSDDNKEKRDGWIDSRE